MKKNIFILLAAALLISLWSCRDNAPRKFKPIPREFGEPNYPVRTITAVEDTSCSDSIRCPSKAGDCVLKNFMVEKDTIYLLTVVYFNGDTTNPSCRVCGTVYQGDSIVMQAVTACPTGGPWLDMKRLRPDVIYTLAACLQRCPAVAKCACGEYVRASAVVSLDRLYK